MSEINYKKWFEEFKKEMAKYGDFSESDLIEMFQAEMLVEYDI